MPEMRQKTKELLVLAAGGTVATMMGGPVGFAVFACVVIIVWSMDAKKR